MKRNNYLQAGALARIFSVVLFATVFSMLNSCAKHINYMSNAYPSAGPTDTVAKWIDWNILFKPNTDSSTRADYLNYLRNYADSILGTYSGTYDITKFFPAFFTCPCDTLLYNFNVTALQGTTGGGLPTTPPPPGKGLGGSGDAVDLLSLNNSFIIDSTTTSEKGIDTSKKIYLNPSAIDPNRTLAVMDTGLDSTLFANNFQGLLWTDPLKPTIRNFLYYINGFALDYYKDDDAMKHGTAVTGLALNAVENYNLKRRILPRVMVLKVLDSKRTGSTFSVSCALSYAFQNHATLVNASLGYYGTSGNIDSVFKHYVDTCKTAEPHGLTILAAAGNLRGSHIGPLCQPITSNRNELIAPSNLFFPACFSKDSGIVAVTGLEAQSMSCFYQNYSSEYITVGVLNNPSTPCCGFFIFGKGYEGSSFATPVVSGLMMGCLLAGQPGAAEQNCLDLISTVPAPVTTPAPIPPATINGRFLVYPSP